MVCYRLVAGSGPETNGKSIATTAKWLLNLGGINKAVAIPVIIGAIGSYPFAGFIKEESLQTLGFGVLTARNAGDLEGEQLALDQQREVLDPGLWSSIFAKIPYANVLSTLKDFYKAA